MIFGGKLKTDISENKILCLHCHQLQAIDHISCERCGTTIHQRKENSLLLTWIFTFSAVLFFIPANLLPMMIVTNFEQEDAGTIMDGVLHFLHEGAYGLAIVIFVASIFIPVLKIVILVYLLVSVQISTAFNTQTQIKLYKVVHFIGKWSMLDIFVVGLMVALVQFGNLATISAGPAATAFALTVISTVMATEFFDTRLLFDKE